MSAALDAFSEWATAVALRRCNGCGLPAKEWGPVCGGMTQGDFTHFHSPEWWEQRARRSLRDARARKGAPISGSRAGGGLT